MRNSLGEPVAYKFMPGTVVTLRLEKARWFKRAGFVNHLVRITPYRQKERYAGRIYSTSARLATACPSGS